MSTKVLVNTARERFHHGESKLYLKEKYTSKLSIPYSGGLWEVTPQLISFLRTSSNEREILIDSYGNPVEIVRQELLDLILETHSKIMSEWLEEYRQLSKLR